MKKNLMILGIIILLICVGLSGCFEGYTSDVVGVWYDGGNENYKWIFYKNDTLIKDYGENNTYHLKWDMDNRYIYVIYDEFTIEYIYNFISDKTILILNSFEYGEIELRKYQ